MPWTSISNTSIDQDSPITVSLMTALRDNPIAIANGDAGAPKVQTAGIADNAVTAAKIVENAVGNSELAPTSVRQGNLSTSLGEVSVTASFSLSSLVALPGGTYGFFPQIRGSTTSQLSAIITCGSTSYTTSIYFVNGDLRDHTHDGSGTNGVFSTTSADAFAQQRYVNSSPPYDIGDGEIPLFVFAEINDEGKVIASYVADVPPWAYNGPTSVRADRVCKASGRKFQTVVEFNKETGELKKYEREVCNKIKNADIGLIPHPFLNTKNRVVLLEPCKTEKLYDIKDAGENIASLIYEGYLQLGDSIKCKSPAGVTPVSFKFRNSKRNA